MKPSMDCSSAFLQSEMFAHACTAQRERERERQTQIILDDG